MIISKIKRNLSLPKLWILVPFSSSLPTNNNKNKNTNNFIIMYPHTLGVKLKTGTVNLNSNWVKMNWRRKKESEGWAPLPLLQVFSSYSVSIPFTFIENLKSNIFVTHRQFFSTLEIVGNSLTAWVLFFSARTSLPLPFCSANYLVRLPLYPPNHSQIYLKLNKLWAFRVVQKFNH